MGSSSEVGMLRRAERLRQQGSKKGWFSMGESGSGSWSLGSSRDGGFERAGVGGLRRPVAGCGVLRGSERGWGCSTRLARCKGVGESFCTGALAFVSLHWGRVFTVGAIAGVSVLQSKCAAGRATATHDSVPLRGGGSGERGLSGGLMDFWGGSGARTALTADIVVGASSYSPISSSPGGGLTSDCGRSVLHPTSAYCDRGSPQPFFPHQMVVEL
ncbi:hypothetical protein B0H13DRAFT_1919165 [Mycena leptocephala]|nr:hypothetical protein B0H13DRAFT_1919165 [Mycena leptocephala]